MPVLETIIAEVKYSVVESLHSGFELHLICLSNDRLQNVSHFERRQDAINALVNAQTVAIAQTFPRA